MLHSLTKFIEQYGYLAVALLVAAEGLGIPLPGETAVVTAAAFAGRGTLDVFGVVLSATIGAVAGGTGGYFIGRSGGRDLLERYGHMLRMDAEKIARAEAYFAQHGAKTVFFSRFVALLRILGGLMAGAMRMPFLRFSVANLTGGLVWAATFSGLGYAFGKNLPELERRLGLVSAIIAAVVVVALVGWFLRTRMKPDPAS